MIVDDLVFWAEHRLRLAAGDAAGVLAQTDREHADRRSPHRGTFPVPQNDRIFMIIMVLALGLGVERVRS